MPNEIKMLKYNIVIVEVPRRGGWIRGAHIVCLLSPFMDIMGIWSLWSLQLEDCYPVALRMGVGHLAHREEPYLFKRSTLSLVKTHGPGPAVPHFLTHKSFTKGLWPGFIVLWWLENLLQNPHKDLGNTTMDRDASRCH